MAHLEFPHNLRNIPRILMIILILSAAGFVWSYYSKKQQLPEVLGIETEDEVDTREEIEKAKVVLARRPDYAAAWLRLAVLYEQVGEVGLAADAREAVRKLDPNL